MLFASTRLTLVRELGGEHFRESIFATTAEELSPKGFEKHDAHTALDAPLTEEERKLFSLYGKLPTHKNVLTKIQKVQISLTRPTRRRSAYNFKFYKGP